MLLAGNPISGFGAVHRTAAQTLVTPWGSIPATTSGGASQPAEGECTSDGALIWRTDHWQRLGAGEQCSTIGTSVVNTEVHGEPACVAQPPADGIIVQIPGARDDIGGLQITPVQFVLAATEGAPVTYYLDCRNPNLLGLTAAQRDVILSLIQYSIFYYGDNDKIALSDLIPDGTRPGEHYRGEAYKANIAGRRAIATFVSPDGDRKNIFLSMGWDQGMNTFTFVWTHQPTAFETIDSFITKISPWDPSSTLCSLLPVATKIPNPYVAVGSVVLQMSGKCPGTCPSGMLYDAPSKTCACPPGTLFDVTQQKCSTNLVPASGTPWYLQWYVLAGAAIALGLILTRKPKTSTAGA